MVENFNFISTDNISKLPETAGVYCFQKEKDIIYIGKAINIRGRAKQHQEWLGKAEQLGYIKTDSEIDALILEARLIKKYQPKYNTAWRDDKNYFYVVVTKEAFPQISITHQPKNDRGRASIIGPFVDGRALKETLKILRKVFPYRTCKNLPEHEHACLWYQLRRCPAPCIFQSKLAREIDRGRASIKKECQRNVKNLIITLKDGRTAILKKLKKEMAVLSKKQEFEQASRVRDQIESLKKVLAHTKLIEVGPQSCERAEAYDIANIQGKMATGAMVVFSDGEPDKTQYRQFKIKIEQKPNDIAMLKEVLERRLKHREWRYPDLILIDGGKAQFNIAKKTCLKFELRQIKVMAIAKKNNELYIEGRKTPVLLKNMPRETFNLILRLRDEAHRFAQRYHHKLREKDLAR